MSESTAELKSVAQYDLIEKIAEGGMGAVYRGRDRNSGDIVAVKIVPKHLVSNAVFLKRFEQEYHAAKALEHPNIVKALDFGRDGDIPYLVMEFVDGESLGARIEREGSLPESESIRIISAVAQGLHKAHKLGLIHRDVKPDNVLLTPDGQVKLTDMGLVKELDADTNLTRTGRGLGTPHFMAPEQFRNAKKADVRCDIYSLAATLYMMATGDLPFKSMNPLDAWMKKINNDLPAPRKVKPDVSERIDWAIRRSMSADPALRAATCREFVEDLTGASTRKITSPDAVDPATDWWYMVYLDEDGKSHTVKGTKKGIRRSLKENLLGDAENIRVARTKQGPFEALREHPEFRDLVVELDGAAAKPSSKLQASPAASAPAKASPGPSDRTPEPLPTRRPGTGPKTPYAPPLPPRERDRPDSGSDPLTNSARVKINLLTHSAARAEERKAAGAGASLIFVMLGIGLGILGYLIAVKYLGFTF